MELREAFSLSFILALNQSTICYSSEVFSKCSELYIIQIECTRKSPTKESSLFPQILVFFCWFPLNYLSREAHSREWAKENDGKNCLESFQFVHFVPDRIYLIIHGGKSSSYMFWGNFRLSFGCAWGAVSEKDDVEKYWWMHSGGKVLKMGKSEELLKCKLSMELFEAECSPPIDARVWIRRGMHLKGWKSQKSTISEGGKCYHIPQWLRVICTCFES